MKPQDRFESTDPIIAAVQKYLEDKFPISQQKWIFYDPAAASGRIKKFFRSYQWVLHDLYPVEGVSTEPIDYLTSTFDEYDCLVTNPPFSLATEFLKKAYLSGKPFALLLPDYIIYNRTITKLLTYFGFHKITLTTRPKFVLPNGKFFSFHGLTTVSWYCGNFEGMQGGSLDYSGSFFMLQPFQNPQCMDTQQSQQSLSGFQDIEYEPTKPETYWLCADCDYVNSRFETFFPNVCPKCDSEVCNKCTVWFNDGEPVDSEYDADENKTFMCQKCHEKSEEVDDTETEVDDISV